MAAARGLATILAVLVGLTGCISGKPTKAEFIARGDKLCKKFEQGVARVSPEEDPFQQDASPQDAQQASRLFQYLATELPKLVDRIRNLGIPAEGATAARKSLRLLDSSAAQFGQARGMIDSGDPAGAKRVAESGFGNLEKAAALAQQYGFRTCGAVSQGANPVPPPANGAEIEIVATDYSFAFPPVGAGPNTLSIKNQGKERHQLALARLKPGASAQEVVEATKSGQGTEELIEQQVGTSEPAAPGESVDFGVELLPGTYGYACFIVAADGEPHAFKGMLGQFDVK